MTEAKFKELEVALTDHVNEMTKDVKSLFVVDVDKDTLWETYLKSFPEGTDPICRVRTEHDCSACRHFVKAFGNVVAIKNGKLVSIWDFAAPGRYGPVVNTLSDFIKSRSVTDVFVTKDLKFGTKSSHELLEDNKTILTWEHLYVELPARFAYKGNLTTDTVRGRLHSVRDVFKRSLDEISKDAVISVLELIGQNSLYKGEEWKSVLESFRSHQIAYDKLSKADQELYCWEQSIEAGPVVGKIRNHSIGVLLVDISNGVDLDEAVRKYEAIVAPSNYKRPKPIFSARMLETAQKTLTELGLMESLPRRYATLSDITVNNILFANRDATKLMAGTIFDSMKAELPVSPKQFSKMEEISLSEFITNVVPNVTDIEVLLENSHIANLVSLIAPVNQEAPSMFKWNNGFSWAYSGNMTDSMRQRVKSFGGKIDGVLRFSIQWNTEGDNPSDFDAHCIEPKGDHIYFGMKRNHASSGELDVDIIDPRSQTKDGIAVENITWSNQNRMPEGRYQFFVHNYSHRGRAGFTAEIEFNGNIYTFAYDKELRQGEKVMVAEVNYNKVSGFTIKELIPSSLASRKLWGLDSNKFHPVSVLMFSPNYWDDQSGIGNRHVFFMMKGCVNEEGPNGFFNEYLRSDLIEHRKVFEALGSKMRVEPTDDQLSGIGFSTTQRNSVVVKVTGKVTRTLKVII